MKLSVWRLSVERSNESTFLNQCLLQMLCSQCWLIFTLYRIEWKPMASLRNRKSFAKKLQIAYGPFRVCYFIFVIHPSTNPSLVFIPAFFCSSLHHSDPSLPSIKTSDVWSSELFNCDLQRKHVAAYESVALWADTQHNTSTDIAYSECNQQLPGSAPLLLLSYNCSRVSALSGRAKRLTISSLQGSLRIQAPTTRRWRQKSAHNIQHIAWATLENVHVCSIFKWFIHLQRLWQPYWRTLSFFVYGNWQQLTLNFPVTLSSNEIHDYLLLDDVFVLII